MQLYRYLNIGTAKPSEYQRSLVNHYMLDIIEPDQQCDAGKYSEIALDVIESIPKHNRILLTGGTFLYIKALLSGLIKGVQTDPSLRRDLKDRIYKEGTEKLHNELLNIDKITADKIHPNDKIRITRALEIYNITGEKPSDLKGIHGFREERFRTCKIALFDEREKITDIIDTRVEKMFENGFIEEVVNLREMGYGRELKPMNAIGYRQVNSYLDGEISLEEAKYLTKRDTRRYAKRQMTWLRKEDRIRWLRASGGIKNIVNMAKSFFES